jgi:Transposase C of IS166 homeodomain
VIAKMQREKFGPRSERSQRLIDQLELQLDRESARLRQQAKLSSRSGAEDHL